MNFLNQWSHKIQNKSKNPHFWSQDAGIWFLITRKIILGDYSTNFETFGSQNVQKSGPFCPFVRGLEEIHVLDMAQYITIHSLKPQFYGTETETVRVVIGLWKFPRIWKSFLFLTVSVVIGILIFWEISWKFLRNCVSSNRARKCVSRYVEPFLAAGSWIKYCHFVNIPSSL